MDKTLAFRLIDLLESMLAENLLLRSQINAFHHQYPESPTAIELTVNKAQTARVLSVAKEMFHPLRSQVEHAETLDQAIERILSILPVN